MPENRRSLAQIYANGHIISGRHPGVKYVLLPFLSRTGRMAGLILTHEKELRNGLLY